MYTFGSQESNKLVFVDLTIFNSFQFMIFFIQEELIRAQEESAREERERREMR